MPAIAWVWLLQRGYGCYNYNRSNGMINEITINSNNAIEMSRGELLGWVNEVLKTNLGKIEQLGSGAAYCQLVDVLYPGKLPLAKVNWKAKFDYEFVANFKILQQTFTKLGIMKHIEVEKLVKCKYQDNLELLQWFKKIFDSNGTTARDYNAVQRRGEAEAPRREKEKENKREQQGVLGSQGALSNTKTVLEFTDRSMLGCSSFQNSDRDEDPRPASLRPNNNSALSLAELDRAAPAGLDCSSLRERGAAEEREFYLRKLREIEHLMEDWDGQRSSGELIEQVRRIILVAPAVQWSVENGEYTEGAEQFLGREDNDNQ